MDPLPWPPRAQDDPQEPREGRVITYREFLDKGRVSLSPLPRPGGGFYHTDWAVVSGAHLLPWGHESAQDGKTLSPVGPGPVMTQPLDSPGNLLYATSLHPGSRKRNTEGSLSSEEKGEPSCSCRSVSSPKCQEIKSLFLKALQEFSLLSPQRNKGKFAECVGLWTEGSSRH